MTLGLPLQRKNMSEPASKRKEATITAISDWSKAEAWVMSEQQATPLVVFHQHVPSQIRRLK
jgi:hypothetical protein